MAFASPSDRLALRATSDFGLDFVLQLRSKTGREIEFPCDDIDHALTLGATWKNVHGAEYAEIFRVMEDGTLKATIGAM